jgi:hypothetical protein
MAVLVGPSMRAAAMSNAAAAVAYIAAIGAAFWAPTIIERIRHHHRRKNP